MKSMARIAFAAAFAAVAIAARADIAYNNFTEPGDGWNTGSGWTVSSDQQLCMPFTSATSGAVSAVSFAMFQAGGNFTLKLEHQDNGLNPGTVMETWNFAGTGLYQTVAGDGSASLVAGQSYWLEMDPQTQNDSSYWAWCGTGEQNTFLFSSGGTWYSYSSTLSSMKVETQGVPEPASIAAIGLGLIGLGLRRRNRRS